MNQPQRKRVVYGAFRTERAPQTTESIIQEPLLGSLGNSLWNLVCSYRNELLISAVPILVFIGLGQISEPLSLVATASVLAAMTGVVSVRAFLTRCLQNSRLRRRWDTACRFSGLVTANDHLPRICSSELTPLGQRLYLAIPAGLSYEVLEKATGKLAPVLEVRSLRVQPDPSNARYAFVELIRSDPFADPRPIPWPDRDAPQLSIWDPIDLAVDEYGAVVSVPFIYQNMKTGGIPGSGKSIGISLVGAVAALDPDCHLSVIDGKDVELAVWRGVADHWAGSDLTQAQQVVSALRVEMAKRYQFLEKSGRRKIERGDDLAPHVLLVDELATFLTVGNKAERENFGRELTDLVSKGRAVGIVVVMATQKIGSDIVPTALRDLFSMSWAFRCATPQASDTILGQGTASAGYDASALGNPCPPGVGYLQPESSAPRRCRAFHLNDEELGAIAARGIELRANRPAA